MLLYNTKTKKKEELNQEEVKIYTCGPTVYNYAHIGNLRAFIFSDILKRTIQFNGMNVKHVMNITDVGHLTSDEDEGEDKMLKGAKREKKTVWDISKMYTTSFLNDLKKLNIIQPELMPKATDNIKEIIEFIEELEKKGFTYSNKGNIYFDTSKFPEYSQFANLQKIENAKGRVKKDEGKKNPRDFVLWFTKSKFQDQEMKWESPWGVGYPGWHIECSAMASKYLGDKIDIHTGGEDHIPVHHTNEIAQSNCRFGHDWVRIWMHSAFLKIGTDKMAKSGNNFLTLIKLEEKGFEPLHYRYFTFTAHYRQQLSFSNESIEGAKNAYEKLKIKVLEMEKNEKSDDKIIIKFLEAINDDLNMPKALAIVWELLNSDSNKKYGTLLRMDSVLGLGIKNMKKRTIPLEILELAKKRDKSRKEKNFEESDKLRNEIISKGYKIEDSENRTEIL